jgi:hypothetical protein
VWTSRGTRPLSRPTPAPEAFLNVPFDGGYTPLYLAAIAGLCGLGLQPLA